MALSRIKEYRSFCNRKKITSLLKRYSPGELYVKVREKLSSPYRDYGTRVAEYLPSQQELETQRNTHLDGPLVSIVVPTYETPVEFLRQMIDSCLAQTYDNWELCIADGSPKPRVEQLIAQEYGQESRIRYQHLSENQGISGNTNQGFAMAQGSYLALLDHDDLLVASALYHMVQAILDTGADLLYSDEDKVSGNLEGYLDPHFKLDYNCELLMGNNYICHLLMLSKELLEKVGGMDSRYDGAQDYDFVLRCSEHAKKIYHVPKILYHWRIHPGSTAGNTESKEYAYQAGKAAVEAALERRGWQGQVTMWKDPGFYQIRYSVSKSVKVETIQWGGTPKDSLSKDIVSTGSTSQSSPAQTTGDYVVLMNSKARSVKPGSIERLLGSCGRPDVGMVAARSVHGRKVVQCGYWKEGERWTPRFQGLPGNYRGYFRRAQMSVEVHGVAPDLVVIKGELWRMILEEHFSDGDLKDLTLEKWLQVCSQVSGRGYRLIQEPQGEVVI